MTALYIGILLSHFTSRCCFNPPILSGDGPLGPRVDRLAAVPAVVGIQLTPGSTNPALQGDPAHHASH